MSAHSTVIGDAAAQLMEIEAVKQLKARYCRFLDAKDWAAWRTIFADDFLSDTSQAGGKVIKGADSSSRSHARIWKGRPTPPRTKCTRRRSS